MIADNEKCLKCTIKRNSLTFETISKTIVFNNTIFEPQIIFGFIKSN